MALEVASTNEPLRLVTAEIFDGWIEAATAWVRVGTAPRRTEARELGIAYITGLEGAFVLARSLRSREPLLATGRMLAAAARAAHGRPRRRPIRQGERSPPMNRTDELTMVRRVFVTALLLSVVHYIDNTVRFDDYTGGKDGLHHPGDDPAQLGAVHRRRSRRLPLPEAGQPLASVVRCSACTR